MHTNAFAAAFHNEAAWHLSTQSDPTAHRHHRASTTVACDVVELDFHRLPSCCGSRPSAFIRYNKSPSLRSSFSRAQPSAPQHDISNNLTLQHLRPIPCILPEDDSFHFQYMYFFFFLYPRNNCTGWYVSGETSLEWSSAVADVHGLWCFWEINAVKHLKYSQWCSMFHLLWKSRTNCRCLKELVFHVRAWQWTSGSFCRGTTNPAAWSLSRLPASPSPRWGRMIYVVVALKLNAVILLLLWFNKHGLKAGETQAVSQISYFC